MGLFDSVSDWVSDNAGGIMQGAGIVMDWVAGNDAEKATKKQADRQADEVERVAQANRDISLYDAAVARRMGIQQRFEYEAQAGLMYKDMQALLASQRTRYAKSGVALKSGSPVDVMEETLTNAGSDIMNIKYKGTTAKAKADSLAARYKLLADKGLRDAAAQASLIEEAASDQVDALKWQKYTGTLGKVYTVGKEYEWF